MNEDLIKQHGLTMDEFQIIQNYLKRDLSIEELGIFSAMWNEHCCYKTSKKWLKKLPTDNAIVIQGPGENAGIIDLEDNDGIAFKIESHNHPSYIEPFNGSATGVGGILRDIFTMGARPIATLDSIRFGEITTDKTKYLLNGVVHGIGHYGNCIGIPNIGGECEFDRSYDFNNLVNAMAIGHVKNDSIFYSKPKTIGGLIVYIGSKTGKDGIHGASMASDVFSEDDEDDKRPSVQVGDPFMEKLLMEGCLELMSSGLIESMQDMGAAGITSSSVEMASKGEVGVLINLDKIPLREPLSPYEILLSESQERMLAVIEPENNVKVKNILKKWQIDYEVIGKITDTQRVVFSSNNKNVVDLPVDIIVDDAPEYDREFYLPKKRAFNDFNLLNLDIENMIDNLFENLNYLDKSWVYNQYDSTVMGDTIKEPGQSSGIVKLHDSDKVIGATTDCNPLYLRINPEKGMEYTVLESFRNLVCSNLKPLAITNNLNFASPLDPNIMGEIVLSINGLKKSASKLDTPIVSGNVSLYNQTNDRPIKPTPVIGMVGSNRNYKNINSNKFQNENDLIFLIGNSMKKNNSPYFLQDQHIIQKENQFNDLVEIDYNLEKDNSEMLFNLFNQNLITSCNDISRGGIFLSLIKMLQKNYGFRINVKDKFDIFCEYQAGYIFTIREINYPMLKNAFEEKKLNYQNLGKVTTESIEINSKKFDYFDIINKYLNNFEKTIN
ncbi:phosphoribosylformylglycinamidine synthase subunit PurL [Alphaproteobacteria bacterium]|nr:phosphoribosylformylglycinamidine synthase subunit PurL [Alphaproteobacteria bacterium]MDB3973157.1 phosphoribosylformylglycinamidine synthase subunit PurL [Alphaproteobacteria bacterium]